MARLLEDFQNKRVEAVLTKIGRFTVARADRIIALGDTMKRRLVETKGADPAKIRVIHNWSDADAIQPGPKDNAVRARARLVDKFVVMHSGNVGMSQDVDALLDVAERLRDLPDVVVAIVGEGAAKAFLQQEAERRKLQQRALLSLSAQGAAHRIVRDGRRLHRVAEARARRLHRAEQAVRRPRRGPSVHRGDRGRL